MNNPYARKAFGKKEKKEETTEEELYEGYHEINANADRIASTVAANVAAASGNPFASDSDYKPPPTASMRPPTVQSGSTEMRPMTSAKGAGYNSGKRKPFDPLQQGAQGPAPPLVQKTADSPEYQARDMEKAVNRLIEESAQANVSGDLGTALEKAKEAGKRERVLCKHREKHGLADQINYDLTYAVCFNLANQYAANGMYTEAINTYTIVVKNKQYPQSGRLRVNMGNIFYQQKKYPSAIKHYRMAMDQIGQPSREMRFKIMRNIGTSFIRLGQFQEAIQSYEIIMDQMPDAQTGYNLIVCYYAIGDKEKMKKGFTNLLNVPECQEDEDDTEEDEKGKENPLTHDELRKEKKERRKVLNRYIHQAAKLIAPVIEKDFGQGYDTIIEILKQPRRAASPRPNGGPAPGGAATAAGGQARVKTSFLQIAQEMEIGKGIAFLRRKNIKQAIEVFKGFERKDLGLIDQAATNLSFLYFLEGDFKSSEKYAEVAVKNDRYNAKALVNKANYLFVRGDFEAAKELYLEAIGVESECVEAIYNLGLTEKRLGHLDDALQAFKKLQRIVPTDPQVIYHIANLYDMVNDNQQAADWFKILHSSVPTDPKVLARLGTLYNKQEDETQAFHNFSDSYTCYPVNMEVISWLGVWYVKNELYEDAIQFFERAAEIEPHEVKWLLMVASCYRRMNAKSQAFALYKKIHKQEPDNTECLRYLVSITKDIQDQSYEEYSKLLRKAERAQAGKDSRYMQNDVKEPNGGEMYAKSNERAGPPPPAANDRMETQANSPSNATSQIPATRGLSVANAPSLNVDVTSPPKQLQMLNRGQSRDPDADEWGDEDLGEDLLPLGA